MPNPGHSMEMDECGLGPSSKKRWKLQDDHSAQADDQAANKKQRINTTGHDNMLSEVVVASLEWPHPDQ